MFEDFIGHPVEVGDKVGVVVVSASAYGRLRRARIHSLEPVFKVIWDGKDKPSNPMRYEPWRIVVLP